MKEISIIDKKNVTLQSIQKIITTFPGKVGFYYKNLITNEVITFQHNKPMVAASVIKIPVLIEVFTRIEKGDLRKTDLFTIQGENKLPSCGALSYMHSGLQVTLEDLYTLMIILSDNTATNLLIKLLGIDEINQSMRKVGLEYTKVNRLLFDSEKSAMGIENYITAGEIGYLLEIMYKGELVSKAASATMIHTLKNQRLNGKIPFFLHGKVDIAHKTGEDVGITHDVGIVYAKEPFVLCLCGNEVDVPRYERIMQDISAMLVEYQS